MPCLQVLRHYSLGRPEGLPKLVEGLKDTIDSIRQYGVLISRVKRDYIDELETCVAELKDLFESRTTTQ